MTRVTNLFFFDCLETWNIWSRILIDTINLDIIRTLLANFSLTDFLDLLGFFVFVYLLVDGIAFMNITGNATICTTQCNINRLFALITGDFGDRLWFAIHLVAAQLMLLSSVAYHTLACNTGICMHAAKLDYSGLWPMFA